MDLAREAVHNINRVPTQFMSRLYTTLHGLYIVLTKQVLYDLSTDLILSLYH